ncbi:hypothetical protein GOBAR_AA28859 [Gossypium barbadense]|uniref:Uncharacterized protein n=1 Tax=Gossypium barbadense TaxID=3634 RepID=A0A2P5WL57_GOSBA|nr:hypothetical protein GOBAR_AA28859 [Gossypium barbadense]
MENQNRSGTAGKAIRCKAAVCRNPGEPLMIEEIEGPFAFFPMIFGHEAVGVVESVEEHVEEFQEGDMVVPVFRPNCRECRDCKSQKGNGCSIFGGELVPAMPRDKTSRFKGMNGETLYHFLSVSSFSEYTVVDVVNVVKISPEFPVDKACLLSCGISTGIGAAWKVADIEEGSTVAIFGLGTVGLAVAEGARLRGASKIIGVDLNQEKIEIDGGADYCFECIGLASLMEDAFNSSRVNWGKTVILGLEMHRTPLPVNTSLLLRGRSVTGCLFGGLKPKSDIPFLAQKYLHKV